METPQQTTKIGEYDIVRREVPTMYFIGVTTRQSSIMRLFPIWAGILGLKGAQLVGVDCPLHADPQQYRQAVAQIKYDPLSLGALVTTHKLDLLETTRDMFDDLDSYAVLCKEVSNIAKRDGKLVGFAKDPITSGRALQEMLQPGYWGNSGVGLPLGTGGRDSRAPFRDGGRGSHALCLGAGGTTSAIAAYLFTRLDRTDRPRRFIAVNRSQRGLDNLRSVVEQLRSDVDVEYVLNEDPRRNDNLVEGLPPGSLIVNATGMGKDRPGSPITDEARFPERAVVWELNYRGELDFLHQAQAQKEARDLRVYDGWRYFVLSWAEHIAEVFHLELKKDVFTRLADTAMVIRNEK